MSTAQRFTSLESSTQLALGVLEEEPRLSYKRNCMRVLINSYLHQLEGLTDESATTAQVEHFNQLKDRLCKQQTQIALGSLALYSQEASLPKTVSETALLNAHHRHRRLYVISTRNGNVNGHRPTLEGFEAQFLRGFNEAVPVLSDIEHEASASVDGDTHLYFRLDNTIRNLNQPLFDYEAVHAGLLPIENL